MKPISLMGIWDDELNWIKWLTIGEAATLAAKVEGGIDVPEKIIPCSILLIRYKESKIKQKKVYYFDETLMKFVYIWKH